MSGVDGMVWWTAQKMKGAGIKPWRARKMKLGKLQVKAMVEWAKRIEKKGKRE